MEIVTERLLLRPWQAKDRSPFAKMNADPEVMRYFPEVLGVEQSDALADRLESEFSARGWGWWVVVGRQTTKFAGVIALQPVPDAVVLAADLPAGALEVGWRFSRPWWGKGLATEAARAVLGFGLEHLEAVEVFSFTAESNTRSRAVMERLGMSWVADFEHPALELGHRLRKHALYRLRAH